MHPRITAALGLFRRRRPRLVVQHVLPPAHDEGMTAAEARAFIARAAAAGAVDVTVHVSGVGIVTLAPRAVAPPRRPAPVGAPPAAPRPRARRVRSAHSSRSARSRGAGGDADGEPRPRPARGRDSSALAVPPPVRGRTGGPR